ncbi:MAG: endolytic transglycosylase MltG [Tissierellia bacterium]|nr:endolytic transglycosylase MltG [Tissierellia bacterium]
MSDKIKLPYLLLGLGIGIIITNLIYSFNPSVEYREYTEEEIISQAKELGMVFVKDSISTSTNTDLPEEKVDSTKIIEETEEELILIVESGDTLEKVSNKLFELGVIENGEDFHKYAKERKLEKKIRIGTYTLESNMDYETITKIITKSL